MRLRLFPILIALFLPLSSALAHADTIETFQLQNVTFSFNGTATGTVDINATTGNFVSADIHYTDPAQTIDFTGPTGATLPFGGFTQLYTDIDSGIYALVLDLPGSSLIGYTGGLLCTSSAPCNGTFGALYANDIPVSAMVTGSLTPVPAPEPSSLLLLGSGLIGAGAAIKRRLTA